MRHRDVEEVRQCLHQSLLIERSQVDEDLAEALARPRLHLQRRGHLLLGDHATLDQQLAQQTLGLRTCPGCPFVGRRRFGCHPPRPRSRSRSRSRRERGGRRRAPTSLGPVRHLCGPAGTNPAPWPVPRQHQDVTLGAETRPCVESSWMLRSLAPGQRPRTATPPCLAWIGSNPGTLESRVHDRTPRVEGFVAPPGSCRVAAVRRTVLARSAETVNFRSRCSSDV